MTQRYEDENYTDNQAPEQHETSLFLRAHRLLRGRYHWAILLGLLFAVGGGAAARFLIVPQYQSAGLMQIKPYLPKIMYANEENGVLPMFDAYASAQVDLMQSQRVIRMAMQSKGWQTLQRGKAAWTADTFARALRIHHNRHSSMIRVTFQAPNPKVSVVAVQAIMIAYGQIHQEQKSEAQTKRLQVLQDRRDSFSDQLNSIQARILNLAKQYGTSSLDQLYTFRQSELEKLSDALKQTRLQLAIAGVSLDRPQSDKKHAGTGTPGKIFSADQLARFDPQMRALIQRRDNLREHLHALTLQFGPGHPSIRDVRAQLEAVDSSIDNLAKTANQQGVQAPNNNARPLANGSGPTVAQLKARYQQLEQLYRQEHQSTLALGQVRLQIDALKAKEKMIQGTLAATRTRLDQLNVESGVGGRVNVIDPGHEDDLPVNSRKRKQAMIAGFGTGGALGVGIIMLLGLIDQRLRSVDDIKTRVGQPGLLGVLPRLPDDLSDPEIANIAAHAVHHIRMFLQLDNGQPGGHVYTISSATPGSGKTSLSLSLGMSFAGSGCKTLLVDCDLVSGRLTSRLDTLIRRRIGQVLIRENLITTSQMENALKEARETGRRLGQVLADTGLVTDEAIQRALALQEQTNVGLIDAIRGEPFDYCVAHTGVEQLHILPVGGARQTDAARIAPADLRRVIDQARQQYDVILVDSGPVPGSIETSAATAAADGVILVVAQGDRRPNVERALEYLESIQATFAGYVFNRANPVEAAALSYSANVSTRQRLPARTAAVLQADGTRRYGALADAVVRASDDDKNDARENEYAQHDL